MRLGLHVSRNLRSYVTAPRPFDDQAMVPACTALDNEATDDQRVAAIMALGVGARRDRLDQVLDLLVATEPDSPLALACVLDSRRPDV